MIGFALSSPPGKPKVAFYNEVPPATARSTSATSRSTSPATPRSCSSRSTPISVHSRAEAIAKVRNGEALAALIIPADIVSQIQSLVTQGVGNPTVQLILNSKDPIERQFVDQAIPRALAEVEQAVSKQVLHVAVTDLQQVLNGGTLQFLGQNVHLLGLRNSRTIVQGSIASLPPDSPLRAGAQAGGQLRQPGDPGARLREPGARLDRHAADRRHDPARGQDDADRRLRGRDRGDRLADVRDAAAGGRDARARALRERLLAADPRAGLAGRAAVGEDRAAAGCAAARDAA